MGLTGKQRRKARALGHHLQPLVQVGHAGVTEALVAAVEQALFDHELVKVRVLPNAPEPRAVVAAALATLTTSEVAQLLGHTVLLYRARAVDPKLQL